jgi:hypothetical protein
VEIPRPGDAAVGGAFRVALTRELMDATVDGIPLVRVGIERVGAEVGIPLV